VAELGACPSDIVGIVVTSLTAQGRGVAAQAEATDDGHFASVLARVLEAEPSVLKIGLVPAAHVPVLLAVLRVYEGLVVLDPVEKTGTGFSLGGDTSGLRALLDRVDLVTPNSDETRRLFGSLDDRQIREFLPTRTHVLLKGLVRGPDIVDRLITHERTIEFVRPHVPGPDPRGTGCALASAIAWSMAEGESVPDAVRQAIAWLDVARTRFVTGRDGLPHLTRACL
jgi:hydroxymethylpyrimidine/phosphomethylpyrimidine kinase